MHTNMRPRAGDGVERPSPATVTGRGRCPSLGLPCAHSLPLPVDVTLCAPSAITSTRAQTHAPKHQAFVSGAPKPCRTNEVRQHNRRSRPTLTLTIPLPIPQLHSAHRQRCPSGLHHPFLPLPLLAAPHRLLAGVLPLLSCRHSALHLLLVPAALWRHTLGRCPVGLYRAMAQLEDDMDCAAAVCADRGV